MAPYWQNIDYAATLNFDSVRDNKMGVTYPQVSIPLFLKELPIPVRQPKIVEVNTANSFSGTYQKGFHGLFYGTPEPLIVQVSGWLRTPTTGSPKIWTPTSDGSQNFGNALAGLSHVSYGELILAYIEGRMQREASGAGYPKHPSIYIDPYGNVYANPVITSFEAAFTPILKKQTFSMSIWLEQDNQATNISLLEQIVPINPA